MNAVLAQQGIGAASGGAAGPAFEPLQLPRDLAKVAAPEDHLRPVLQALLGDAACTPDGQLSVIAGSRAGRTVLLAPWFEQAVGLAVRLGEKVLWAQPLPGIRLPPAVQDGVVSESDALALLACIRATASRRALVLTDVALDAPLYGAVLKAGQAGYLVARNEPDTHLFHRFVGSYDEFFKERSSKQRNQLRTKEKVLAEQLGQETSFREYRLPQEVAEVLAAAKAINRKTYQYRMFGETIDDEGDSAAAAQRAAAAGCFRSFVLWHRERPVCFIMGHQRSDGTFEHRFTGFDPDYREAAPGINCNILLLQRLYAADRPMLLDFGSGDSDYKRLFSNLARTTSNPVLLPRKLRFLLAYGLYEASAAFNRVAVACLQRLGVKEWIKRRLRGAP